MDTNKDQLVSFDELRDWLIKTMKEQPSEMSGLDMDKNRDERISWDEYLESQMIE